MKSSSLAIAFLARILGHVQRIAEGIQGLFGSVNYTVTFHNDAYKTLC